MTHRPSWDTFHVTACLNSQHVFPHTSTRETPESKPMKTGGCWGKRHQRQGNRGSEPSLFGCSFCDYNVDDETGAQDSMWLLLQANCVDIYVFENSNHNAVWNASMHTQKNKSCQQWAGERSILSTYWTQALYGVDHIFVLLNKSHRIGLQVWSYTDYDK